MSCFKFFDKKSKNVNTSASADKTTGGANTCVDKYVIKKFMLNKQLAEELHKPIIKNLKNVKYIHP